LGAGSRCCFSSWRATCGGWGPIPPGAIT